MIRCWAVVVLGYFCVCGLSVGWTAPATHVQVVLDLSQSMKKNDPSKQALLATSLLLDLASPNTFGNQESFTVIPFNKQLRWNDINAPPTQTRKLIKYRNAAEREAFINQIQSLPYDARCTHFYPGLKKAIEELKDASKGSYDSQVIVLLTDGVPEKNHCQYAGNPHGKIGTIDEAHMIKRELIPVIIKQGIALYVLAFGPSARRESSFFNEADFPSKNIFLVDNGEQLVPSMVKIFNRAFGYQPLREDSLNSVHKLVLNDHNNPGQVAVVAYSPPSSFNAIDFDLHPPRAGKLQSVKQHRSNMKTASYQVNWVLSPDLGNYKFILNSGSTGNASKVAVLAPVDLNTNIVSWNPATPLGGLPRFTKIDEALAQQRFVLGVEVQTAYSGKPPDVDVWFRYSFPGSPDSQKQWTELKASPTGNTIFKGPNAHIYPLPLDFRYIGSTRYLSDVEVEIRRSSVLIAELKHKVAVYPDMKIVPSPLSINIDEGALLSANEAGCAEFIFDVTTNLPGTRRFRMLANLDTQFADLNGPLLNASFTMNGKTLSLLKTPITNNDWDKGIMLSIDELKGPHKICVTLAQPKKGGEVETPLTLQILTAPYDQYPDLITTLTVKVRVDNPGLLEKRILPLLLGFLVLLVVMALWYLRYRPALPDDFRIWIWFPSAETRDIKITKESQSLEPSSLVRRIFTLSDRHPVFAPGQDHLIAWLVPIQDSVFILNPINGVTVEAMPDDEMPKSKAKGFLLMAEQTYRLSRDGVTWNFRAGYDF